MIVRKSEYNRVTGETDIQASINLDGSGEANIKTGLYFFDHMLTLLTWFSFFDITIISKGSTPQPDDHHIIEDVGITLGYTFRKALGGDMSWGKTHGIKRYGYFAAPMDESLILCSIDIYTRGMALIDLSPPQSTIGDVSAESLIHFFEAFAQESKMVLHINQLKGTNTHHIFESAFKSLAIALEQATRIEKRLLDKVPGNTNT